MSRRLSQRLLASALLPMLPLALLLAWALQAALTDTLTRAFDARLATAVTALVAALELGPDGTVRVVRAPPEAAFAQVRSGWYWQVTGPAGPLARSRSLWDTELPPLAHADADGQRGHDLAGPGGESLRRVGRVVRLADAAAPWLVEVAATRAVLDAEIARFRWLVGVGLGGLVAAVAIALWLQVRLGLAPLRALGTQLAAVERGEREAIETGFSVELDALATEINRVLARNRELGARTRRLGGDLAHALKTPLALVRAGLEQGDVAAARAALARTDAVLERQLALAVAAARGEHRRAGLLPVLHALRTMFATLHRERPIDIVIDVAPALRVAMETEDLQEVLGNLVDNACRAARTRVHVGASADADRVLLVIEDDGPGLDDSALARLGTRGLRFDETTPGSGLGVAIASDLVTAAGGHVAYSRGPAGGLRIDIDLPA
jgi:signal transduction histidine kinase